MLSYHFFEVSNFKFYRIMKRISPLFVKFALSNFKFYHYGT